MVVRQASTWSRCSRIAGNQLDNKKVPLCIGQGGYGASRDALCVLAASTGASPCMQFVRAMLAKNLPKPRSFAK